ncbi:MAG: hypothetical protein MI799_09570 [Desulfobacterales bacterium]|nr:hypothetical protein [Desulfobacterales bacterium]
MTRFFNEKELEQVATAALRAEEMVYNYFKLSSSQWLKNRYDIKTARDLLPHERVEGPFAQVLKYEGRHQELSLGSSVFSLYHVCIQDPAVIMLMVEQPRIGLAPFLLYILVHELVHVVRFARFEHRYENACEADVTLEEEKKVHGITHDIIVSQNVAGMPQVFEFYEQWY